MSQMKYRENEQKYGGMPKAGPVRVTRSDGTTEIQRALTYRERRNLAATGLTTKRKNIDRGVRLKIYKRDGYRCVYCCTDKGPFQLDHVRPYSKGGWDDPSNLVTACLDCNARKSNTWDGTERATP